jgi:acetyltransferase-like isoleucine patch superfamily enzyme
MEKRKTCVYRTHPHAIVESRSVGRRTTIWAFSHVMDGAIVGEDCNIGENVFVESGAKIGSRVTIKNGVQVWEGVTLEDDVFVGPNTTFANDRYPRSPRSPASGNRYRTKQWLERVVVRKGASIGANSTIICGVEIGEYAVIGAGAVVTKSVPPFSCCYGVPATVHGFACMCGRKLQNVAKGFICVSCKRTYVMEGGILQLSRR